VHINQSCDQDLLAADLLVLLVLASESSEGWVDHSSAQAEHKVEGGLLLDVVVLEGAAILKLLSGEDETLLVRRDSFLILDLGLHSLDSVGTLNLKGDCLPRQGLDEDL